MYSLVVGDLEPDMEIDLTTNGQAVDLTGATALQLQWLRPDGTIVDVALVAIDLTAGRVKRQWVAGDSAQAGTHYGRVIVTMSNGETETFPNDGSSVVWNIYTQLGS